MEAVVEQVTGKAIAMTFCPHLLPVKIVNLDESLFVAKRIDFAYIAIDLKEIAEMGRRPGHSFRQLSLTQRTSDTRQDSAHAALHG